MDHKKLLVLGAIAGVGFGCSGSNDTQTPPVTTKGTLQIRTMMDYTGPTSDNAAVYYQGIKDAMREANAQGGIKGYKLDEQFYDHAYVLDRAQKKYDEWKADPSWASVLMFFSWGTPDSQMFSADAAKEGKPFISGSYANTLATPVAQKHNITLPDGTMKEFDAEPAPFNFFAGTDYGTQARIGMEFVKKRSGHKVGFAYCRESPFCAEPIPAGRTWAKQIGLDQGPDTLDITLSDDYATVKKKMSDYMDANGGVGGPDSIDWYWAGNSITTSLYVAKALREHTKELGKPDEMTPKVINNMWGMDERAWEMCGADCVGNTFVVMSFASYGDLTVPGMEQVVALHDKYRMIDGDPLTKYANVRYVQGYVSFFIFQRALEQVIDHGKAVNGRSLKEEFESFRNLESGGLTAPISYTGDDHRPTNRVRIYSMNQYGKFQFEDAISVQLQTDWMGW
jgi:branched-chain amino acid transport system substrate-binding protein